MTRPHHVVEFFNSSRKGRPKIGPPFMAGIFVGKKISSPEETNENGALVILLALGFNRPLRDFGIICGSFSANKLAGYFHFVPSGQLP